MRNRKIQPGALIKGRHKSSRRVHLLVLREYKEEMASSFKYDALFENKTTGEKLTLDLLQKIYRDIRPA